MKITTEIFEYIDDPLTAIGTLTPIEWLKTVNRPICIYLEGKDTSRTRALSTLLHGNEPSGFYALINWLKERKMPAVNVIVFIPSVLAALREPHFHNRTTDSGIDLNRVFLPPFTTTEGKIAQEMLGILEFIQPESLVDIHNTSGISPDFSVVCKDSELNQKIAALFTNEYIIFNLRLNTLVEAVVSQFPSVVIECGGADDPESIINAQRGIDKYLLADDLSSVYADHLNVRDNPIRIKLKPELQLDYHNKYIDGFDLVLPTDADKYNSSVIQSDDFVGWVGGKGLEVFDCVNMPQEDSIEHYFYIKNNELRAKVNLRLYMVTTRLEIALSDCLFYLLKSK